MSEWTKQRTCETCHQPFTLRNHGHPGAQATAAALERGGGYDPDADYFALRECPQCAAKTKESALRNAFAEVAAKRDRPRRGLSGIAMVVVVIIIAIAVYFLMK